jgi:uncharacterized repeat protein (TIGR03803 family)
VFGTFLVLCGGAGASTIDVIPLGNDASLPTSGLAADASGNLYGTTYRGGNSNDGVVFELIRGADGSFTYTTLYAFCPERRCRQAVPQSKLVVDVNGNLYGTTIAFRSGGGSVFELMPNADRSVWTLQVLHRFCGFPCSRNGTDPEAGLTYAGAASGALYDGVSALYGTTTMGGQSDDGIVFKLVPGTGAGPWKETILHQFNDQDGISPHAALMIDGQGRIFGTAVSGGSHQGGTVFELIPGSKGNWDFNVLYNFCSAANCADGRYPLSDLIEDAAGDLFGTTSIGGNCTVSGGCGVAFKLGPGESSWKERVLHSFCKRPDCADGSGPSGGLVMDGEGNLFGTTVGGGIPNESGGTSGVLYKLPAGGGEQVVYDFCSEQDIGHCIDGSDPAGDLLLDASGNLFGVTSTGGTSGVTGIAYKLTP